MIRPSSRSNGLTRTPTPGVTADPPRRSHGPSKLSARYQHRFRTAGPQAQSWCVGGDQAPFQGTGHRHHHLAGIALRHAAVAGGEATPSDRGLSAAPGTPDPADPRFRCRGCPVAGRTACPAAGHRPDPGLSGFADCRDCRRQRMRSGYAQCGRLRGLPGSRIDH